MNKQEVSCLVALNKVNYPNSPLKDMSSEELNMLIDDWHEDFKSYPAELIMAIYREAKKECKFPVTVSDIFGKMKAIKAASRKTTEQLWQEFLKASRTVYELSYSFHFDIIIDGGKPKTGRDIRREAQELFDNLDPELRRYAGDLRRLISFGAMDKDHLEQYMQSNFRKSIECDRQRQDIFEMTSPAALAIGQGNKNLMIEG